MKHNIMIEPNSQWNVREGDQYTLYYACSGPNPDHELINIPYDEKEYFSLVKDKLSLIVGFFAVILNTRDHIYSAVDHIRSYPVFFSHSNSMFNVSNCATSIRKSNKIRPTSKYGVLEFAMSGYTAGRNTLFEGMFQLQAGEFLVYNKKDKSISINNYFKYKPRRGEIKSNEAYYEELDGILNTITSNVIDRANGSKIWIPLSGGLDSRLIACKIKEHNYTNVSTFSYGPPKNYEATAAKNIAATLGYKWQYVSQEATSARELFNSKMRKEYWTFASGDSSVPVMNDFHSIKYLKESGLVDSSSIIINGQSGDFISGGHIPKQLIAKGVSRQDLEESLIEKHYNVWGKLLHGRNLEIIANGIRDFIDEYIDSEITDGEMAALFELWEWKERQAKLVVNGQRVYDFFDLKWELPLWDRQFVDFWRKIPVELRYNQQLFKMYLKGYNYLGLFESTTSESRRWVGKIETMMKIFNKFESYTGLKNNWVKKYFSYWGHYSDQYMYYGYKYFVKNIRHATVPPQGRGIIALGIKTFFEEEGINFPENATQ